MNKLHTLAARGTDLVRPFMGPLRTLGAHGDTLKVHVFPVLAFTAMLTILVKLTVF